MTTAQPLPPTAARRPLTTVEWLICVVAAIGFAFDIYELLMLPLILPAGAPASSAACKLGQPRVRPWAGYLMFYVPALAGGIFGLLGGYLTDRLGRRRVLVWSILLYAFSALAAGFSTSLPMLLVLRCTTFVGVCVEFVAAVAWLAELFPDPKQRETVLGYTQAFSSLGGLMVTRRLLPRCRSTATPLPAIHGGHEPWRYTLISGLIPAIPLIVIRPFLPESPVWAREEAAGTLKRPSLAELFRPLYRAGPRSSPPHVRVQLRRRLRRHPAAAADRARPARGRAPAPAPDQATGREHGAAHPGDGRPRGPRSCWPTWPCDRGSRRKLLRIFQVPGLFLVPLVFLFPATHEPRAAQVGDLLRRLPDRGPVQLLGKLPAAGLSRCTCAAPARASPPTSAAA